MKRSTIFLALFTGIFLISCSNGGASSSSSSSSYSSESSFSSSNSQESSSSSSSSSESISSESISSSHVHSYSSFYSYDENYHWYPTICGHDDVEGVVTKEAHTFGEWVTVTEADCTNAGRQTQTCSSCGYVNSRSIDPTGHSFEEGWTYDSNGHWHASSCGHAVVEGYASHSFGEWVEDTAASEEAEGSKHRNCKICSYQETETIPQLDHTHKYEDTYSADDDYHWYATTCNHDDLEGVLNKVAHTYGELDVVTSATCTENGSGTKTCSVCQHVMNVIIPATGHTYLTTWSSDETGHWHDCKNCDSTSDFSMHSFGEWVVTTSPQCEVEGIETRTCSVCSYAETRSVEPTGHTYSEDWNSNEYGHWHVATCGHNVQTGFEEHSYGEWFNVSTPQCEVDGEQARVCSVCSYREVKVIPATGHTYSETWSYDENYHYHAATCGHSDARADETAHEYGDFVTTTEASCTEDGSGYRECSTCGYKKVEAIPATGHSYSGSYDYDGYQHYELTNCGHDDVEGVLVKEDHVFEDNSSTCSICGFNYLQGVIFTLDEASQTYSVTGTDETFYSEMAVEIIIPDTYNGLPVTSIGKGAFSSKTSLVKVTLPDSITSIGQSAFRECSNLTSINFPEGLTSIAGYAFYACRKLNEVSFPSTLESIGMSSFNRCSGLDALVIPDSVTSLGTFAFAYSYSISSLTLGNGLTSIPEQAFAGAFLTGSSVAIKITIPDSVTSIGASAFSANNSIRYVDLGANLESLAGNAFSMNTKLETIVVPKTLTSVGFGAFNSCSSLANVYYRGSSADQSNMTVSNNADDTMSNNNSFINAIWYYYSETKPGTSGNYWRFVNGVPTSW